MKKSTKSKKTTAKPKEKDDSNEYYTKEEIERLDKFHEATEKKFEDDEIYALMEKYKDDDEAILNELKEQLKERKRGDSFEWKDIGKNGKVANKKKEEEKNKNNDYYNYNEGYDDDNYNYGYDNNYNNSYNNYYNDGYYNDYQEDRRYNNYRSTKREPFDYTKLAGE